MLNDDTITVSKAAYDELVAEVALARGMSEISPWSYPPSVFGGWAPVVPPWSELRWQPQAETTDD